MSNTDNINGKNCLIAAIVLAGSIFLAPQAVRAQDAPAHDANGIYAATGADKGELDKIKTIGTDFESRARANYNLLMLAAKDMQSLSLEPTLDEDKLLTTQEKINKITADMSTDRIKQLIACRKILKPDERAKLVELLKKRREANAANLGRPQ